MYILDFYLLLKSKQSKQRTMIFQHVVALSQEDLEKLNS